jgi:folate-binding protein YgfZ
VLRAKVRLRDASAEYRLTGTLLEQADGGNAATAGATRVRWDGNRILTVHPVSEASAVSATPTANQLCVGLPPNDAREWRLADIRAGLPQVYAASSELFVAQMLNLDLLGAIAFDKGCYTGQEVIARAHYRGRVKRRMQRFRLADAGALAPEIFAPGAVARLGNGKTLRMVHGVVLANGSAEFLAVATYLDGQPSDSADTDAAHSDTAPTVLQAEPLELPYPLPNN